MAQLFIAALEIAVHVWDFITYPISFIIWRPWSKLKLQEAPRSKVRFSKSEIEFQSLPLTCQNRENVLSCCGNINTLDKLFDRAIKLFGPNECLGTRKVLKLLRVDQPDDSVLTKLDLDDKYTWQTYEEVGNRIDHVAAGLYSIGLRPGDKVIIYADTCSEWLITALACFKSSLPIVTIYTNLGKAGVSFSVNQIGGSILVTSQDLLAKVSEMMREWPTIRTVVYFENPAKAGSYIPWENDRAHLIPFRQVEQSSSSSCRIVNPTPDDIAVIMYTSGSTGEPKGVLLTHSNLLSSLLSACALACNLLGEKRTPDEAYLAYLPLAHIFELTHEILVLGLGIKVGYSSPNTLTDNSSMIVAGQKGDASVLRPTTMPCVPIILDRIYKGIRTKIQARGSFFQLFFDFCFRYRRYWITKGFDTPVLNAIVFKKLQMALGGKMRAIIAGGAPLSPDVHEFLRICLRVNLAQGYGLTETVGGISLSDCNDLSVGCVGRPLPDVKVKLENWEEGGYTVSDAQGPRGEIVVGGPLVANGYYNLPEKTAESFYEENGTKWFRTGDIGQLSEKGTLMIIDRKKDLVKLQMGEYISLGKVEACLKVHPLVDNVCVYADSTKSMSVALVVPNGPELISLASINGSVANIEDICKQPSVVAMAFTELRNFAMKNLEKFEIPKQITFIPEVWTPETELVTAAMKLKRKQIQKRYQVIIDQMYQTLEEDFLNTQKLR